MKVTMQKLSQQMGQKMDLSFETRFEHLVDTVRHLVELSPVKGELSLAKVGEDCVEVTGKINAEMKLICSRCLARFPQKVEVEINEKFAAEKEDEEEEVYPIEAGELDLLPMLKENMVLAIPYAPICNEDCKGLCPVCGNNRNVKPCSCEENRIDPRFEKLQGFFAKEK
jgi:uncharacterized protein